MKDYDGLAIEEFDGRNRIFISDRLDFNGAISTLAHELAHVLVDMNNTHDDLFRMMYQAMLGIVRQISREV